ncbi:MAG: hypothetical protein AAGF92_17675 [Myxococcota bacterium]
MEIDGANSKDVDLIGVLLGDYLAELGANRELPAATSDIRSYTHLDSYRTDPGRHPFLIRSEASVLGFALVRDPRSTGMSALAFWASVVPPLCVRPPHTATFLGGDGERVRYCFVVSVDA